MTTLAVLIATIYLVGFLFSPFPYWRTFFVILGAVLTKNRAHVGLSSRLRQLLFLLRYPLLAPLWTALWYCDEIFFGDYRKVQVRPVFILGQGRSGTTFLHRTLAADKSTFTAVRHYEWRYPFLILQKIVASSRAVQRILEKNYWSNTEAGRIASKMHPNNLMDWEEDAIYFEECFLHHIFSYLRFPYPDILPYLDEFPGLPTHVRRKLLHCHRKSIQKVMYLAGGDAKYFVSKEVAGHNKLPDLQRLYPEARFVFTLRPSSDFMSSLLPLVRHSSMSKTGVDPDDIPRWEEAFIETIRNHSLLLVDLCGSELDKSRQTFITFEWLTSDVVSAVEYIYRQLGLEIGEDYRKELNAIGSQQKERSRGYQYEKRQLDGFQKFDEFVADVRLEVARQDLWQTETVTRAQTTD